MNRRQKNRFLFDAATPEQILTERQERSEKRRWLHGLCLRLLATALLCFLLFGVVFGLGWVDGGSMHPVLEDGDLFLYYRLCANYETGDVVVLRYGKGELWVKRVVGCAGDTLSLDNQGNLLVNGAPSTVEVFYETTAIPGGLVFPYTVQPGEVVLMGDHRSTSLDSRNQGAYPLDQLQGKVVFLLRSRF